MAVERNTQIPIEAIEGAAGVNDKFDMNASITQICCDKSNDEQPTKSNTKTVMSNPIKRTPISIELMAGMSIKVKSNGVAKDRE